MKGYTDDRHALAANTPEWLLKYYSDKSGNIGVRSSLALQKDLPFISALNKVANATYSVSSIYGLFRFTLSRMVYQTTKNGLNVVGSTYDDVLPTQDYINPIQVIEYKAKIATGQKILPIIAYRQGGKLYIEEGHHRFVAYMQLGIKPNMIIKNTGGPVGFSNWSSTIYQLPH